MTSPGTPLPTRRPVWSLTQPCKRRVSATSFLRGIQGTEELRYLPEIPQQGRGPWGSRRLHSGTRLPSTPPPPATCPSSPLAASGAFRPPSGQPSLRLECFTLEGQRSPGVLLFLLASKRLDFGCHAGLCPVPLLPRRRRLRELNTRDTKTGQTGRSQRRGPRGAFRRGRGGAHEPPRHEPPGCPTLLSLTAPSAAGFPAWRLRRKPSTEPGVGKARGGSRPIPAPSSCTRNRTMTPIAATVNSRGPRQEEPPPALPNGNATTFLLQPQEEGFLRAQQQARPMEMQRLGH